MSTTLASLLFKDYRRRVLGLLLLHPETSYHVREIARLTDTVAGTLHKELTRLAEAGVLRKATSGNQVRYSADPNCLIDQELATHTGRVLNCKYGLRLLQKCAVSIVANAQTSRLCGWRDDKGGCIGDVTMPTYG